MDEVIFYEEVQEILCWTACQWVGVPVDEGEFKKLANQLAAMFETPAKVGPPHWLGRNARNNVEGWLEDLIEKTRNGEVELAENSTFSRFIWYRDLDEQLLDSKTVAVEVLNLLRPTVAVAIYINFIVLALDHYPEKKRELQSGNEENAERFVQEVRRFYPFFPMVVALVKEDFVWKGYKFEEGTLTMLDLYGTNHDPKVWEQPEAFNPNRFTNQEITPFNFIPQGGGERHQGHRCPGENITVEIMKVSLDFLVNRVTYEVPEQDLDLRMNNIPCIPESKVIINNVKRIKLS